MAKYDLNQYIWTDHSFQNLSDTDWQSVAAYIDADIETTVGGFEQTRDGDLILPMDESLIIEKYGYLIKATTKTDSSSQAKTWFGWERLELSSDIDNIYIKEISYGWPLANAFVYTDQNDKISMSASVYNTGSTWVPIQGQPRQTENETYAAANGLYYTELSNYTVNSKRLKVLTNAFLPTDDNWVLHNRTSENAPKFKYIFNTSDTIAKTSGYGHRRWRTENINCIPLGSAKKEGEFDTATPGMVTWSVNGKINSYTVPSGGKCVLIHRQIDPIAMEDFAFIKPEADTSNRDADGHMVWQNAHLFTPVLTQNNYRWGRSLDRYADTYYAWSAMSNLDSVLDLQSGQTFYDELSPEAQNAINTANINLRCSYKWKEVTDGSKFAAFAIHEIDSQNQDISNLITPNLLFFYWHWTPSLKTIPIEITSNGKQCDNFWGLEADRPRAYIQSGITYKWNFNLSPWMDFHQDVSAPKITYSLTETASTIRPCDLFKYSTTAQNKLPEQYKNHGSMFSLSSWHGKLNFVGIPVPSNFFWEWYAGTTLKTRKFPIITKLGNTEVAQEIDVPWFGKDLDENTNWSNEWSNPDSSTEGNWWVRDLTNGDGDLDCMSPFMNYNGNVGWVTNWFEVAKNEEPSDTYGLYWVSDKIVVQAASSMPEFQYNRGTWPDKNSAWWSNWMRIVSCETTDVSWPEEITKCIPVIVSSYSTKDKNQEIVVKYNNQTIPYWYGPEYIDYAWKIRHSCEPIAISALGVYCIGVPCSEIAETSIYIKDIQTGAETKYWSSTDVGIGVITTALHSWETKEINLFNNSDEPQRVYLISNQNYTQRYTQWKLYKVSDSTLIAENAQTITLNPQEQYRLYVKGLGDDIIELYNDQTNYLIDDFIYALKFIPANTLESLGCLINYSHAEWDGTLQYWQYSANGGDWADIDADVFLNVSQEYPLYVRGFGNQYCRNIFDWGTNSTLNVDNPTGVFRFNADIEGVEDLTSEEKSKYNIHCSGNVMALLDYRNHEPSDLTVADNAFYGLFATNWSLINSPKLLDVDTTLSSGCYRYMFHNCGLSTVPALPHQTLSEYCYQGMFADCTNLTSVPAISASTFPTGCCESMFKYAGVRYKSTGTENNYRLPTDPKMTGNFIDNAVDQMFCDLNNNAITMLLNRPISIVYQDTNDNWYPAQVIYPDKITNGTGGGSTPGPTPH